jgi:LmbE family N-acetylglucosaminyl deacetylase
MQLKLGLPSHNISFFEYTQGVDSLFNTNWDKTLNVYGNHTPSFAYQKNAPYTGVSLEKNMESVITDFRPTIIIYPDPNDSNRDHWGTSSFVEYATNNLNYTCQMYTYLVHVSPEWPFPPSYFPQTYILPPPSLANQNKWVVFPIKDSDEKLMYNAINSYKSQINKSPTYQSYLTSFVRKNELFIQNKQIYVNKNNMSINYLNGSAFPETISQDPSVNIQVHPNLEGFYSTFSNINLFHITKVGFEVDNNTTWISLNTVGGISKTGIYHFSIRSFGNNGVNRIDIQVQNGTAKYEMLASNSEHSSKPLEIKIKGNGIIIGIPSNLFTNTKYMISVDSMKNNQYLYRDGWYTINLQR